MAIYDATVAAWESKYFYNRTRPSEVDATLATAVATPRSPSYPSEHAAAAGAAATVLAYFFPDEASSFQAMAEEAAQSRVQAGVQFPATLPPVWSWGGKWQSTSLNGRRPMGPTPSGTGRFRPDPACGSAKSQPM